MHYAFSGPFFLSQVSPHAGNDGFNQRNHALRIFKYPFTGHSISLVYCVTIQIIVSARS